MADGTLKVGTITTSSGSGTITLGQSGETVDMANGSITLNSSMKNTPAFYVYRTSAQSLTDDTDTKVTFETKGLDTDNAFDITTNHRFTVPTGKAGKYYIIAQLTAFSNDNDLRDVRAQIYKNGSRLVSSYFNIRTTDNNHRHQAALVTTIDDASAGDYYEMYTLVDVGSGSLSLNTDSGTPKSIFFLGYRMIGA